MPRVAIELRTELDDKEFQKYIQEAIKRGLDLKPPLQRSAVVMFSSFDKNFKNEGRPKRWKALAPNTIAGRRRGRGAGRAKILQDTGRLRMSTMAKAALGNIYKLGKDFLKMGSNLKIASYHQEGTSPYTIVPKNAKVLRFMTISGYVFRKKVRHPGLDPRPFILIQEEDATQITGIFADYVVGQ